MGARIAFDMSKMHLHAKAYAPVVWRQGVHGTAGQYVAMSAPACTTPRYSDNAHNAKACNKRLKAAIHLRNGVVWRLAKHQLSPTKRSPQWVMWLQTEEAAARISSAESWLTLSSWSLPRPTRVRSASARARQPLLLKVKRQLAGAELQS